MRRILLLLAIALPLSAHEAEHAFARGLALLHNFEYESAAQAFQEAQKIDPSFAMAYWGEAMTHTHPIWFQQDRDAARAILARGERLAKPRNDRERDYLRAVDVLYGDGEKEARDFLYADAMAALHARYPDDVDATAFYALALLGTAHAGRDFAIYMRAASLLEEVLPANARHPGVLHYLIHSYDDPVHAPLGMRAARVYGDVAPDAPHALHMTSHIFVALGMWDDVIAANRRAIDVGNEQRAARGRGALACGHYPTWLHYGLLQKGRVDDARKSLEACGASVSAETKDKDYADMRAQAAADGVALAKSNLAVQPAAQFTIAYADALDAARRGDTPALKAAAEQVRALQKAVTTTRGREANPTERVRAAVMVQEIEALELIAAGKRDAAIAILEAAAKAERAMPIEFGPPVVPKPAAELLAEQLLAAGRADDAVAAYQLVLERTPGRARAVEGLARAGKKPAPEKTTAAPHIH
jgi:hypothetical protein